MAAINAEYRYSAPAVPSTPLMAAINLEKMLGKLNKSLYIIKLDYKLDLLTSNDLCHWIISNYEWHLTLTRSECHSQGYQDS